jgi:Flp pilus assembly protein TadG
MKSTDRFIKRIKDATGATLLEAALVTPLLLLLTFSIADFGGLFYVYLALESGVSQATRFAVTGNAMADPANPGTPLSRADTIKAAMRSATPTLTIPDAAFTFQHMAVGGTTWLGGVGGPNEIEKVTVNYDWPLMTPLLRPFFTGGKLSIVVESMMKNESRFQ